MRTTLSYRKLFYHQNYNLTSVALLCLLVLPIQAAKQILPTFSATPIGPHATYFVPSFSGTIASLYVGAYNAVANNQYTLAVSKTGQDFISLSPATITLNNQANSSNPIYGAKISLLGLIEDLPAVVINNDTKIYLLYSIFGAPKTVSAVFSANLNDSADLATPAIIKLTGSKVNGINYLFAAVKSNSGGAFGSAGSGISTLKQTNSYQNDQNTYALSILNNNTATALTGSTTQVYINNPATVSSDLVDLYWNNNLNRLYIALSASTAAAANSGARAIVIGNIVNNQLQFTAIAPDAVFSDNTGIVGTNTAASTSALNISIQKINSLTTSTCLDYLIVAGGNNTAANTGNLIYALPLVNSQDTATNGTLANCNSAPTVTTVNGFFRTQAFTVPATTSGDILTNDSSAAQVGAGPLPMPATSQITDLFTIDDTVFASISDAYAVGSQPGLFCSQALFDDLGRIQGWTPWQRAGGTDAQMFGAGAIPITGDFWYIPGTSATDLPIAQKTVWGTGAEDGLLGGTSSNANVGLVDLLNWPIQGLINYSQYTPGLSNCALLITTGLQRVSLVETGRNSGFNSCRPNSGDFATDAQGSNNGSLPILSSDSKLATIANGDLTKLGPITTSTIATKTVSDPSLNQHWIIVGGSNGIAVLCDNTGAGWTGNLTKLSDLPLGLAFKQIGNYKFVQKLTSDGTYLYVLTNGKLDKILLSDTSFANNTLNPVTLIESNVNSANALSFSDLIISSKLALLATSKGLLRTGNGADIRTAANQADVDWTQVTVPESIGPVYKLWPLSPTNNLQDFALGGNLYVLSAYRGYLQTTINRFTINLDGNIDDSTVLPFPDQFVANQLSYFINFHDFKDAFNYLGGAMYVTHALDNSAPLTLQKLPNNIKIANRLLNYKNDIVTEDINPGLTPTQINPTIISSASGALLTSGNFGLRVDE